MKDKWTEIGGGWERGPFRIQKSGYLDGWELFCQGDYLVRFSAVGSCKRIVNIIQAYYKYHIPRIQQVRRNAAPQTQ